MLKQSQTFETSIKENLAYQKYIADYMSDNGTDNSYYKSATKLARVGAEQLNLNQYNALVGMTLSNHIEVYDKSLSKWIRVIINEAKNSYDTNDTVHSFECVFNMPELNLQF